MCLSKWQAFKLATLSGLAEPLGVIIVGEYLLFTFSFGRLRFTWYPCLFYFKYKVYMKLWIGSEFINLFKHERIAAYLFPSSLNPEILEGLLGAGWYDFYLFLVSWLMRKERHMDLNYCIFKWIMFSVGGVMAFLTLHEMLPLAFDYAGQKRAVKAVFFGMAFMSARWDNFCELQWHSWWLPDTADYCTSTWKVPSFNE